MERRSTLVPALGAVPLHELRHDPVELRAALLVEGRPLRERWPDVVAEGDPAPAVGAGPNGDIAATISHPDEAAPRSWTARADTVGGCSSDRSPGDRAGQSIDPSVGEGGASFHGEHTFQDDDRRRRAWAAGSSATPDGALACVSLDPRGGRATTAL